MLKKSNKYKYITGKQITDAESGKRVYEISNYRLPSVTTVLGATKNQNFLKKPSLIIHTLVANMDEKKEITDKAAKRILCNKELDVHIAFSISFPGKLPNGSMPKTSDKKYALTTTMQRDVDNSDYNEELEEDEE